MSITQSVRLHDGRTEMETARFSFDPTSWRAATDRLRSGLATPTCLYSLERCEPEEAASREHVIPQATGTRWVDLPPGLVSDAVNGSMSEHEKELFQKGMLGALMPWYVTGKRSVAFVDGPVTVEFRNDPKDGFLIKATTPTGTEPFFLREGEEATCGTLSFPITVDEANPRSVSLVIHKIAYLALCVTSPDLAFSSMLDESRGYLCEKDRRAFRPYTEAFLPGLMSEAAVGPGFAIDWLLRAEEIEHGRAKLRGIVAKVKLHHVLYTVTLGGTAAPLPEGPNITAFRTPVVAPRRRRMVSWAYGRAEQTHPKKIA